MADDKNARDKKALDVDRRQRLRDVAAELERMDETEPPVDERELGEFEADLEALSYPVRAKDVVAAVGERTVKSPEQPYRIADIVPESDTTTYPSARALKARLQRPTIGAAMKRIVEATEDGSKEQLGRSHRKAYEKTLRVLASIDADDDDKGIRVIDDWIVERIEETGTPPTSREVRRQAATFCRSNGYKIRNDEWLGI